MIVDKRYKEKIYEGGHGLVFVGEYLMKSSSLSLLKADENIIEIWYIKGTDLRWNIIVIESNFQPHWVFYIRYSICDVSNIYIQIGLISDTGDSYIQLVIIAEISEPTIISYISDEFTIIITERSNNNNDNDNYNHGDDDSYSNNDDHDRAEW